MNSKRKLQVTLTSSVAKETGASIGKDSATDDWITHGVSSCKESKFGQGGNSSSGYLLVNNSTFCDGYSSAFLFISFVFSIYHSTTW